jgi:hypothetical protein
VCLQSSVLGEAHVAAAIAKQVHQALLLCRAKSDALAQEATEHRKPQSRRRRKKKHSSAAPVPGDCRGTILPAL